MPQRIAGQDGFVRCPGRRGSVPEHQRGSVLFGRHPSTPKPVLHVLLAMPMVLPDALTPSLPLTLDLMLTVPNCTSLV